MQPRIAIPSPTSHDEAYNRLNWPVYAEAIRASGGEPVAVPLNLSDIDLHRLLANINGILLPGSPADVNPALYGHELDKACAPSDPTRERTDRLLLEQAPLFQWPVLAICFGMQMLNVVHGGTLIQDLAVLPVNHPASRAVNIAHTVVIKPESRLASQVDSAESSVTSEGLKLPVNSSHHQAVGMVGKGLAVVARCPQDGVVEAIEPLAHNSNSASPFVVGVQWHPERTVATSATSRALFARLVAEAAHLPQPL